MKTIYFFLSVFMFFKSSHTYIFANRQLNPCENTGNAAAVEHFFNIVFTEFHNIPPVCICVQMCVEKPTYCYPNGCLRIPEKKRVEIKSIVNNINSIQNERTKSSMFLVENQKDFVDDINNYAEKTEKPQPMELIYRPNPFKELVLKYKKMPKLEMRYNLREQVKNTKIRKLKREQIDLSKTRWPSNKNLFHGKQLLNGISDYRKSNEIRPSKLFLLMFPELEFIANRPKSNKKNLTKRENHNGVNFETLYLYNTDTANFSLETLIDSLIENTLDMSKNKYDLKINKFDKLVNSSEINQNNTFFITKENSSDNLNRVNIFSINSTNEKIDSNKYFPNTNTTNDKGKDYLEMIAIMSGEIDKQNKVSIDLMERLTGNRKIDEFNNISSTIPTSLATISNTNDVNITVNISDYHTVTTDIELVTTTIEPSVPDITSTMKSREGIVPVIRKPLMKSKQRITRKLHNKNIVF